MRIEDVSGEWIIEKLPNGGYAPWETFELTHTLSDYSDTKHVDMAIPSSMFMHVMHEWIAGAKMLQELHAPLAPMAN
jgi:hypothetical protein